MKAEKEFRQINTVVQCVDIIEKSRETLYIETK